MSTPFHFHFMFKTITAENIRKLQVRPCTSNAYNIDINYTAETIS